MYSNNILYFQESTTILNACTKKSGNLLKAPRNCVQKMNSDMFKNVINKISLQIIDILYFSDIFYKK